MTMETIPPYILGMGQSALTSNIYANNEGVTVLLDATNEACAMGAKWQTPDGESRSITHICWATGTVGATNGTIRAQLETLDSTGLPTGTLVAAGATSSKVMDGATDDYTWHEMALDTAYTMANNTWMNVVLSLTSASGSVSVAVGHSGPYIHGVWVASALGGAAWSKSINNMPNVALKCSTGEYIIAAYGWAFIRTQRYNIGTDTTPRYRGNKIICGRKSRLIGFLSTNMRGSAYDYHIRLVDASGNIVKADDTTTDMDIAWTGIYHSGTSGGYFSLIFPKPKTLEASSAYYLIISPDTTDDISIPYMQFASNALLKQSMGIPSRWTFHSISSPSSWAITENDTTIISLFPIFDQIDFPAGVSGGGPIMGGMVVR